MPEERQMQGRIEPVGGILSSGFLVSGPHSSGAPLRRLVRTDDKAASALSRDLASKIVTVLDRRIEDLLEVVDA